MNQSSNIENNKAVLAFWEEVLTAHLSGAPVPEYHMIPMTAISKGWDGVPLDLVSRARRALDCHEELSWKLVQDACPETGDLLQKLEGAGQSSALSFLVMACVRGLISAERYEQVRQRAAELRQTRYKLCYQRVFTAFFDITLDYVRFLETNVSN